MCEAATPPLTIDLDEGEKEKVQFRLIPGKRDDRRRCMVTSNRTAPDPKINGPPAFAGTRLSATTFSLRKEVIQPQVLLRLPCYDFTPIMNYTLGGCSLAVSAPTSSATHFRDVTGGVYKARERIHRSMLICDY